MRYFCSYLILFLLYFFLTTANSTPSYFKQWDTAVITGSIHNNSPLKYYLETQIRLINDDYGFNQSLLLGGVVINSAKTSPFLLETVRY